MSPFAAVMELPITTVARLLISMELSLILRGPVTNLKIKKIMTLLSCSFCFVKRSTFKLNGRHKNLNKLTTNNF
jgi:hypothetical protein